MSYAKTRFYNASIIIPVYNCEDYLGNLLAFFEKYHSEYNYEIIIVNDASTDNSKNIIEQYPSVKLINFDCNKGRSDARNMGANIASGDILIFIDADCLPKDKKFFDNHYAFHKQTEGILMGHVFFPEEYVQNDMYYRFLQPQNENKSGSYEISPVRLATGNVSIKFSDWQLVGGFDNRMKYFEDVDLGIRCGIAGLKVYVDNEINVLHCDRRINIKRDLARAFEAYSTSYLLIMDKDKRLEEHFPFIVKLHQSSFLKILLHSRALNKIAGLIINNLNNYLPELLLRRVYRYATLSAIYHGINNYKYFLDDYMLRN